MLPSRAFLLSGEGVPDPNMTRLVPALLGEVLCPLRLQHTHPKTVTHAPQLTKQRALFVFRLKELTPCKTWEDSRKSPDWSLLFF